MNPKASLVCLINGHQVKRRVAIGIVIEKEPTYPVCIGCHRRIRWDHQAQQYILTNPFKGYHVRR